MQMMNARMNACVEQMLAREINVACDRPQKVDREAAGIGRYSREEQACRGRDHMCALLICMYEVNKSVQEILLPPLVEGRSIVQEPSGMGDEAVRAVQRDRLCVKPMYICNQEHTRNTSVCAHFVELSIHTHTSPES